MYNKTLNILEHENFVDLLWELGVWILELNGGILVIMYVYIGFRILK